MKFNNESKSLIQEKEKMYQKSLKIGKEPYNPSFLAWISVGLISFSVPACEAGNTSGALTLFLMGVILGIIFLTIIFSGSYLGSDPNGMIRKNYDDFNTYFVKYHGYDDTNQYLSELESKIYNNKTVFIKDTLVFDSNNTVDYFIKLLFEAMKKDLLTVKDKKYNHYVFTFSNHNELYNKIRNVNIFSSLHRKSLVKIDEFMISLGLNDYGVVDITRSSHKDLKKETYFYSIDSNKTLKLALRPYLIVNSNYVIYNYEDAKRSKESYVEFNFNEIKDFQLFGTEMMESTIETIKTTTQKTGNIINKPKILGTMFNEFVFGSSYATLKGMSSMMRHMADELSDSIKANQIGTSHRIVDTRKVQVIFSDSTDIELKGVSVFYDFNRKMGKSKNIDKDNQKPILDKAKETVTEDINNKESIETKSLKDEIREFKSMLDEGLIDEDEFKKLKNRTIEKYN